MLIDADGYLKLGDFGFAKAVGQRGVTRSFCGTPDYLAPEVVFQRVSHHHSNSYNTVVQI